jgi:hypothetical protein
LDFVQTKYFSQDKRKISLKISRPTRLDLEHRILKIFDYQICTAEIKERIKVLATEIVTIDSCPLFIFKEVAHFLQKNRVILPGYTVLQELIGGAISNEEKRLAGLINTCVNKDIQNASSIILCCQELVRVDSLDD